MLFKLKYTVKRNGGSCGVLDAIRHLIQHSTRASLVACGRLEGFGIKAVLRIFSFDVKRGKFCFRQPVVKR